MMERITVTPNLEDKKTQDDILEAFRTNAENTLMAKFAQPALEEIGIRLGLDAEGKTKRQIIALIRDYAHRKHREQMSGAAAATAVIQVDTYDESLDQQEELPQFAMRCPACGEVAIKFQPGFDPKEPIGPGGNPMPFHRWPLRFVGWPHQDKEALQHRSREIPKCPRCEHRLPVLYEGRMVDPSSLVRIR